MTSGHLSFTLICITAGEGERHVVLREARRCQMRVCVSYGEKWRLSPRVAFAFTGVTCLPFRGGGLVLYHSGAARETEFTPDGS